MTANLKLNVLGKYLEDRQWCSEIEMTFYEGSCKYELPIIMYTYKKSYANNDFQRCENIMGEEGKGKLVTKSH